MCLLCIVLEQDEVAKLLGDEKMSVYALMDTFYRLQQHSFASILQSFLDEAKLSKSTLYEYLWQQGYWMEKTSMYKYFSDNPKVTRLPEEGFLRHFAAFVQLSPEQTSALYGLWELKRQQRQLKKAS
jgi:hypothetical protein